MGHPTDRHVGRQVCIARQAKGLNQAALGEILGISFQQVHKYESGENRISASRLWEIAKILDTPVSSLFEGLEASGEERLGPLMATPSTLDLVKLFDRIPSEEAKEGFIRLIRSYIAAT